jgi:hypothetical protein
MIFNSPRLTASFADCAISSHLTYLMNTNHNIQIDRRPLQNLPQHKILWQHHNKVFNKTVMNTMPELFKLHFSNRNYYARFEVLTAVLLHVAVFCDVMLLH